MASHHEQPAIGQESVTGTKQVDLFSVVARGLFRIRLGGRAGRIPYAGYAIVRVERLFGAAAVRLPLRRPQYNTLPVCNRWTWIGTFSMGISSPHLPTMLGSS